MTEAEAHAMSKRMRRLYTRAFHIPPQSQLQRQLLAEIAELEAALKAHRSA